MTRVSIVTVNLNNAAGLGRTLESVGGQLGADWESIVVDGVSSDGSQEVAGRFQGEHPQRVKFICEPDSGIYDAMNTGIDAASGGLVIFMNSGDRFATKTSVADMSSRLETSGRSWGYGVTEMVADTGDVVGWQRFDPFDLTQLSLGRRTIPHQATIFSSGLFERFGVYRTDVGIAADQELMFRFAIQDAPIVWDATFAQFELGGVGSSRAPRALPLDFHRFRRDIGYRMWGLPPPADWAATGLAIANASTRHTVWKLLLRSRVEGSK